ncbi:MAG: S-layer homology domain-containing protein [Clostridiales bacterium]|nr:S-layer homology domain-containing protein [Clostridiales bacterium]
MKKKLTPRVISFMMSLLLMLICISLFPVFAVGADDISITAAEENAKLDSIIAHLSQNVFKNTADNWAAVSMSALGFADDVAGKSVVEKARHDYINGSVTDMERNIIALTALGVDASHVFAGELFVDDYLDFLGKVNNNYGYIASNLEAVFALIALDSGNYDDSSYDSRRADYISFLLDNKLSPAAGQAAWAIAGTIPNVDTSAMAVAALAPYYQDNTAVAAAVDGALAWLSATQNTNGHYGDANGTAMVVIALCALGIDADHDPDFTKNTQSLLDGLLSFVTADLQFGRQDNSIPNLIATEQGFRALVAYRGYLNTNKAYCVYHFGAQSGDGTALTGENDPENELFDPNAPKQVTVRVEDLYNGATLMPKTAISLSGTHLDALKSALIVNGYDPGIALSVSDYGYITSILGIAAASTTGWMYALNDRIPTTTISATRVASGDTVTLFYVDYFDTAYLTKFDKDSASLIAGNSLTLTLSGLDSMYTMYGGSDAFAPISGATVYICDSLGNRVGTGVATNVNGQAMLSFPNAGTYMVGAEKTGLINKTALIPPLCQVTVSASAEQPASPGNIKVSFTLIGDSKHGSPKTHVESEIWLAKKSFTVPSGSTVKYLTDMILIENNIPFVTNSTGEYIVSINGLAETNNGPTSGWMYRINGKIATDDSYAERKLKAGDDVIWFYTDDLTKEIDWEGGLPGGGWGGNETAPVDDNTAIEDTLSINSDWKNPFSDVKENDCFYEAVRYVNENGLMNGISQDIFSPNAYLTRAMLVTILYRYDNHSGTSATLLEEGNHPGASATPPEEGNHPGASATPPEEGNHPGVNANSPEEGNHPGASATPPEEGNEPFSDVLAGQWYTDAVAWANANGLATGYGDGRFGTNDNITREQFAAILYRFAQKKGLDISKTIDLTLYKDAGQISAWANTAIKWAVASELIQGRIEDELAPLGTATRGEAAMLLMIFIQIYVNS